MNLESERSYLAACKLNIMLAHTVLNDDVKMENEGRQPPDVWLASSCILIPKGQVLFRKRATYLETFRSNVYIIDCSNGDCHYNTAQGMPKVSLESS